MPDSRRVARASRGDHGRCVLEAPECTLRPSAAESKSCIDKPSFLSPVAMGIVSASCVDDAVEPFRFDVQAKGHIQRLFSETSCTQRPLVLLLVSRSPFRSISGDIQISHLLRSEVLSMPKSSMSACCNM